MPKTAITLTDTSIPYSVDRAWSLEETETVLQSLDDRMEQESGNSVIDLTQHLLEKVFDTANLIAQLNVERYPPANKMNRLIKRNEQSQKLLGHQLLAGRNKGMDYWFTRRK